MYTLVTRDFSLVESLEMAAKAGFPAVDLRQGRSADDTIHLSTSISDAEAEAVRGQVEAARSTGLTRGQTMTYVVLPQAIRNVLPDLISNTLEVVKLTSIASVVALPELLFQARQAQSVTYNATPIMAAAVVYFILLWPVVRVLSRLENRR